MDLSFTLIPSHEIDSVIWWLASDTWPYHGKSNPTPDSLKKTITPTWLQSEESQTFWIMDQQEKVGMLRLFDLLDLTPLFDLRMRSQYRGKGIGQQALTWLTHHIFQTYPQIMRIEGYTRQDNRGMRRVFQKCSYVKEAHHRKSWPTKEGHFMDSVGYGILRNDWEMKKMTPVNWNDEVV